MSRPSYIAFPCELLCERILRTLWCQTGSFGRVGDCAFGSLTLDGDLCAGDWSPGPFAHDDARDGAVLGCCVLHGERQRAEQRQGESCTPRVSGAGSGAAGVRAARGHGRASNVRQVMHV